MDKFPVAASFSRDALRAMVMNCMKPPSFAEKPLRCKARSPNITKGNVIIRLSEYGTMRLMGEENL